MLNTGNFILVIIVLHILGAISGFIIIFVLENKKMLPNNAFWMDLCVVGGVLWIMSGILAPFIIWLNYYIDKKK